MAVKRWNGTAWEVYAGADLAPVKVTDGRVGKTTFIGATSPTGQVDGDIWIDQDTATNAVVPTALTAKGDIFAATGNAAYSRLAAGSNGESLFADSSTSTGLRWQGDYNTGKNKILNGDFSIWQRTTSYTPTNSNTQYGSADRWMTFYNGGAVGTNTVSRQTFTPGQTAVPGNPTYFIRTTTNGSATQNATDYYQRVEDASTFAGQTVTLSFWAQASNSGTIALYIDQNFGSGGSVTAEATPTPSSSNFTTTWARYTSTFTLPSISGKTIGSGSFVGFRIRNFSTLTSGTFDIAQVQLELGSVATPFTTATGNQAMELMACQRYYIKKAPTISDGYYAVMMVINTTSTAMTNFAIPVVMRARPTASISGLSFLYGSGSNIAISSVNSYSDQLSGSLGLYLNLASASILGSVGFIYGAGASYIEFSAEL
jgi:hypothetical protein